MWIKSKVNGAEQFVHLIGGFAFICAYASEWLVLARWSWPRSMATTMTINVVNSSWFCPRSTTPLVDQCSTQGVHVIMTEVMM